MTRPPAFQFYTRDWRGSSKVQLMSLAGRGAYAELLCVQWQDGFVPNDDLAIARLLGCTPRQWRQVRKQVLQHFELRHFSDISITNRLHDSDILVNKRLHLQRTAMTLQRLKSVKGGHESAKKRGFRLEPKPNQGLELGSKSASASATAVPPYAPPEGGEIVENQWTKVLERLFGKLGRHAMVWFRDSTMMSWDEDTRRMVVRFPPEKASYVIAHYIGTVNACLEPGVNLEIVESEES